MLETMFQEDKYIVSAVILLLILKTSSMVYACPYAAIIHKYIPHNYINGPSMFNCLELLNVTDKNILLSVSTCVKEMILLRNSIVNV